MAKQLAMPESLEEMPFPIHGISLLTEFGSQTPGTTPIGKNVRAFETLTQRNRGGSRPGLAEYINSPIDGVGGHVIQHLNVIVDPTTDAVLDDFSGTPFVTDPSTNNLSVRNPPPARHVRPGGGAGQPNRNKKKPKTPIKLEQTASDFNDVQDGSLAFGVNVKVGDLIVVVAMIYSPTANTTNDPLDVAITDSQGNSYTEIASVHRGGPFTWTILGVDNGPYLNGVRMSMFYAVAKASAACTVSWLNLSPDSPSVNIMMAEYSGTHPTSPFNNFNTNIVNRNDLPANMFNLPYTGTSVSAGANNLAVMAFFDCVGSTDVGQGFKDEFSSFPAGLYMDNMSVPGAITISGTASSAYVELGPNNTNGTGGILATDFSYFFIGASFKPKPAGP
jgi:hypothetical protein